jgi:hypothetical protein
MRMSKSALVMLGAIAYLMVGSAGWLAAQPSPVANYDGAGGTPAPLGYVVWTGQPGFVPPGQTATIEDGSGVELISRAGSYTENNDVDLASATFYLTLRRGSTLLAQHAFSMTSFAGNNIWLIGDPGLTEPNGSFSPAFLEAMMGLGAGRHELSVGLYLEYGGSLVHLNQGTAVYDASGGTSAHQTVLANLRNASEAWQQNVETATQDFEEQYEADRAAEDAARNFTVTVRNRNSGRTRYLVVLNRRTLSEEVFSVQPSSTRSLRLSRAGSYDLLVYDQDQTDDDAVKFAEIDESDAGTTLAVQ